jgi:hypothetical protein
LARSAVGIVEQLVLIYYKQQGGFGGSVINGTDSWPPNKILEELKENKQKKGTTS